MAEIDKKLTGHVTKHVDKLKRELKKETDAAKKTALENEIKRLEDSIK